jgi:molybdopterin-containing oxidoreductase family membrane subunit
MTTLNSNTPIVDNTVDAPGERAPLVLNMDKFSQVTATVCRVSEAEKAPTAWYIAFAAALGLLSVLGACIGYLIVTGVGVWGGGRRSLRRRWNGGRRVGR